MAIVLNVIDLSRIVMTIELIATNPSRDRLVTFSSMVIPTKMNGRGPGKGRPWTTQFESGALGLGTGMVWNIAIQVQNFHCFFWYRSDATNSIHPLQRNITIDDIEVRFFLSDTLPDLVPIH